MSGLILEIDRMREIMGLGANSKLIISEQERNYIRNLYDLPLLNEQETEDDKPTEGKKSDLKIEKKIGLSTT